MHVRCVCVYRGKGINSCKGGSGGQTRYGDRIPTLISIVPYVDGHVSAME